METQDAQTWSLLQCTYDFKSNSQSTVHLPWFHLGHCMHWHHALCGLGSPKRCWEASSVSTWAKGGLPSRTQKTMCESLWGKLKDWYNKHKPTSQIQAFGVTNFKKGDGSSQYVKAKSNSDKALGTIWCQP